MNPDLLVYACIPLFVVYFYFFQRTFGLLDESEPKRFVSEAGQSRWRTALTAAFVLVLFLLADPLLRAVVGVTWLADTAWQASGSIGNSAS